MAETPEEGISVAGDPRPDLPRIALGPPLEGHWVKIDTDQLRMSDFETVEAMQGMADETTDPAEKLRAMTKLLRMMRHVVVATSLPGESIADALGDLRASEFQAVTVALSGTASVPKAS